MEYRRLGRSGLQVSVLALGTMNFGRPTDKAESIRILDAAIDAGVNLIDCADVYAGGESERILGQVFRRNKKRGQVLLTSKVYNPTGPGPNDRGNSRHHILAACENSLRQLQTDYLDIYFLHRSDFNVPQEETLAALDLLVRQGKIRYAACSTHPAWRTVEALHIAERYGYPRFICESPPYNLLDRRIENEILPMCAAYDLGVLAWSPLAHGVLAGRYSDADRLPEGSRGTLRKVFRERITPQGIETGRRFVQWAEETGRFPAQLAVAWVIDRPGVTATILGPRSLRQLEGLLPAAEISLTEEDRAYFDTLVPSGRYATNYFNTTDWMK
jgi:aryl-alcohol dehydrogenase-like predicted oxidoreductase